MAQLELVEQLWLIYESTASWRASLVEKHVLVGALVGAMDGIKVGALDGGKVGALVGALD